MLEALVFHPFWCLGAQRKGMVITMKKQKTREDAFNWILENFSVDGAAGRIISNILEYADDLSEEEQVEFMNKMLDGTIGLTEDEIENLCWNA